MFVFLKPLHHKELVCNYCNGFFEHKYIYMMYLIITYINKNKYIFKEF